MDIRSFAFAATAILTVMFPRDSAFAICIVDGIYDRDLEVVGVAADSSALAVRARSSCDSGGSAPCTYPAINGKTNNGTELYLCKTGEPLSKCRRWTVYAPVPVDTPKGAKCTPEPEAKAQLAAAKVAFAEAKVELNPKLRALKPHDVREVLGKKSREQLWVGGCGFSKGCGDEIGSRTALVLRAADHADVELTEIVSCCTTMCVDSVNGAWLANDGQLLVVSLWGPFGRSSVFFLKVAELKAKVDQARVANPEVRKRLEDEEKRLALRGLNQPRLAHVRALLGKETEALEALKQVAEPESLVGIDDPSLDVLRSRPAFAAAFKLRALRSDDVREVLGAQSRQQLTLAHQDLREGGARRVLVLRAADHADVEVIGGVETAPGVDQLEGAWLAQEGRMLVVTASDPSFMRSIASMPVAELKKKVDEASVAHPEVRERLEADEKWLAQAGHHDYELACVRALLGKETAALEALKAVDPEVLKSDDARLDVLRTRPGFAAALKGGNKR